MIEPATLETMFHTRRLSCSVTLDARSSLESCEELTASQAQECDDCPAGPRASEPQSSRQQERPPWKMYTWHVDVTQAPVSTGESMVSGRAPGREVVLAHPQPVRPYRCIRPTRPKSAVTGGATAQPAPAHNFKGVASGLLESPVQIGERTRPESAHARLTYTSESGPQTQRPGLVSREERALQQAASGLADKATANRPMSARSRAKCHASTRRSVDKAAGRVACRSSLSLAATFSTPICISPTDPGRPVSASRIVVAKSGGRRTAH